MENKQHKSLMRRFRESILTTNFGLWFIRSVASNVDPTLLKLTGGWLSTGSLIGFRSLLLTTTGAKSGLKRETTLIFGSDEDCIVLIASNYGSTRHPGWYYNLRANPEAHILLGKRSGSYVAHEAQGDERERMWQIAVQVYGGYENYAERAGDRQIPVMVLTPA